MPARHHRVTRGEDYRSVVRTGRRVGGALCITHAAFRAPEAPARFGFIISKAVGNAVTRNRIRRRLKTVVERRIQNGISGVDIVFRVLPAAADASFGELEAQTSRAMDRLVNQNDPRASTETGERE